MRGPWFSNKEGESGYEKSRDGASIAEDFHEVYAWSLNLHPENPSQSPPVDSRSGLGFCTGNWDGIPPSWAAPPAAGDPRTAVGGILAVDRWYANSDRSAAASSACNVAVAAAAADANADADVDVAVVRAVVHATCSSARKRGRFASRSEVRPRALVLNPSGRSEASRTRDLVSRNSGSKAAARGGTALARSVSRPSRGSGAGTSAPRSHLPKMAESTSPVGESGVGVW